MTRRKVREHLFAMLFCLDFHPPEELPEQISLYLEEIENLPEKIRNELEEKFQGIVEHLAELDANIEAKSRGWDLNRLAKADITVLRLAVYELLYDDEVPTGVAINEAVELAGQYGTDKSASFVNGVLSTIAKENPEDTDPLPGE